MVSRRQVVLGGGGFLGSHLCDHLLARDDGGVSAAAFPPGRRANVSHLDAPPGFTLVGGDIPRALPVEGRVEGVFTLASPAPPPASLPLPLETLAVGSEGTRRGL